MPVLGILQLAKKSIGEFYMITIIYFIITLINKNDMSWLPFFIDCTIGSCIMFFHYSSESNNLTAQGVGGLLMCFSLFAAYKYFFSLSVSAWWILISPIYVFIVYFIPGSVFFTHHLLEKNGLAEFGTGAFIFAIISTIFSLVLDIFIIYDLVKKSKIK